MVAELGWDRSGTNLERTRTPVRWAGSQLGWDLMRTPQFVSRGSGATPSMNPSDKRHGLSECVSISQQRLGVLPQSTWRAIYGEPATGPCPRSRWTPQEGERGPRPRLAPVARNAFMLFESMVFFVRSAPETRSIEPGLGRRGGVHRLGAAASATPPRPSTQPACWGLLSHFGKGSRRPTGIRRPAGLPSDPL